MILSDRDIERRIQRRDRAGRITLEPFAKGPTPPGQISGGLTSGGYDLRLGDELLVATAGDEPMDPKKFNNPAYRARMFRPADRDPDTGNFILPHRGFALGFSVERMHIPDDVICVCVGKSTYHRCGIIVSVTPAEPEWEGQLTLEIQNAINRPAIIYPNEGICQILFHTLSCRPGRTYKDKGGKYMNQSGITVARVE